MPLAASFYWSMRALRAVSPRSAERVSLELFKKQLWTLYDIAGSTGDKVFALMNDEQIDARWRADAVRSLEAHGQTADDIARMRRSVPEGTAIDRIFAAIEDAKRSAERGGR